MDPAIHRGFSVKWGSKDAELQLGITENWGWKRYPTQRKLRWNPLERKAIKVESAHGRYVLICV